MIGFLKIYKGLPKNVYILFLVQLINRFGDFVVPFLALYLTTKLGYSAKIAGTVATCAVLLQIPGSMIGGMVSDWWSRKGTYLVGQSLAAVCILLCAFLNDRIWIVSLLLLSSFCAAAVKPTLNTMVFDLLSPKDRKIGASLLYLGINLGVAIGPLVGGFLFNTHLRLFFIGDAVTSFIAVALVLFNFEGQKKKEFKRSVSGQKEKGFAREVVSRPEILVFLIAYCFYCFIYTQSTFSLPLTLERSFKGTGSVYFGYLMSINAITVVALTAMITYITRKKASLFNITLGGICYAVGFGMIGIANSFFMYALSTVLWTVGEIFSATNCGVYIANRTEDRKRARYTALMTIISSTGKGLGILTMGGYIEKFGISSVWIFIMILGFIASGGMYLLHIYTMKKKEERLQRKLKIEESGGESTQASCAL